MTRRERSCTTSPSTAKPISTAGARPRATLALNDVTPADVTLERRGRRARTVRADGAAARKPPHGTFNVPAAFVELAQSRDPAPRSASVSPCSIACCGGCAPITNCSTSRPIPTWRESHAMAKAVRRDEHKMHAFVRFREIGREHEIAFVAWFEPEHHIVELAAPFFARRFADMPWSILTPDVCAHWDGHAVSITPGVDQVRGADARTGWRRPGGATTPRIFNPARLKVKAMQAEMPKKYWRNLPEASLIQPLIEGAERTTSAMIANAATEPHKPQKRLEPAEASTTSNWPATRRRRYRTLREEAADCRACPLWKDATQTVFGEGPQTRAVMLVGEQPGDKEDLAGKPFVGPAGQMLDRALEEAGIDRSKVYVTNAVKHFKFVPRGKIRLHQKPNTPEIKACRQWYERELAAIKPDAGGGDGRHRGAKRVRQDHADQQKPRAPDRSRRRTRALVTVHPSYLLRLPDAEAKAREYQRFVEDLKIAAAVLRKSARAA